MTNAVTAPPTRRWWRRILKWTGITLLLLVFLFWAGGGFSLIASLRGPSTPFTAMKPPPAPDYARPGTWLAFPGRNGLERSTPPGLSPVNEADAPADVFFVPPTTFKGSPVWNAPFDASDDTAPLNPPVLLDQVSAFNGCCRLYAPHYRQATLAGLKEPRAMDIAYGDVAQAFHYYLAHENKGRPFIIASHSQGTAHAVRLLQAEILGKPIQSQLVAAYLIGGYVPDTFGQLGLPICNDARQTGCVISYNTSQAGRTGARMISRGKRYWWRGRLEPDGKSEAVCVNPLSWKPGAAPASANKGSLPFPVAPFGQTAKSLPALVSGLTGATCHERLLDVDIAWSAPAGFIDKLSLALGSYHLNDYGIFYSAIRGNAIDRVGAWRKKQRQ